MTFKSTFYKSKALSQLILRECDRAGIGASYDLNPTKRGYRLEIWTDRKRANGLIRLAIGGASR